MDFDVVFEGGGAKGAVFVGAMKAFEQRGHRIRRCIGTSAGAIQAALLASGYQAQGLQKALMAKLPDGSPIFRSFADVPASFPPEELDESLFARLLETIDLPFIPNSIEPYLDRMFLRLLLKFPLFRQLYSLIEKGGFYEGNAFVAWFEGLLEASGPGLGKATFEELTSARGIDLSIIASDITGERMLVLNRRTAPRCPVAWAVRMSMSIPFVWQEVVWSPSWGTYRGQDISGHRIVDGGMLSNFPIHLLSEGFAEVIEIMGNDDPRQLPNIGFLIDETLPVTATVEHESPVKPAQGLAGVLVSSAPLHRLQRIVETMLNAHDRVVIERCMERNEVCRLPARGYSAVDFEIPEERLELLVESGYQAAQAYFDQRGI